MIKIKELISLSEKGKRQNNEDYVGHKDNVFVLCDGVGGAEKGEVASSLIVKAFLETFSARTQATAEEAIVLSERRMTDYIEKHPEAFGMASTLTLTVLREDGIYVAWVGDSRVYQFREGEIIFQTEDHSWVNEAVKNGILTSEEAIGHPKSNIITRAIQGTHRPVLCDSVLLTDLKPGDYIFQCSDGVLESFDNDGLISLFTSQQPPADLLKIIQADCEEKSRDNYTALIYRVSEVNIPAKSKNGRSKTATNAPDPSLNRPVSFTQAEQNRGYTPANPYTPVYRPEKQSNSSRFFQIMELRLFGVMPLYLLLISVFSLLLLVKSFSVKETGSGPGKPSEQDSSQQQKKQTKGNRVTTPPNNNPTKAPPVNNNPQ